MQSAIKTCARRLHINMCGGLIGIEYVCGWGRVAQESKVSAAKTVNRFCPRQAGTAHRSQLNFVCTCVARD